MPHILDEYNVNGKELLEFKEEILLDFTRNIQEAFEHKIELTEENVTKLSSIIIDEYDDGKNKDKKLLIFFKKNFLGLFFYLGDTWMKTHSNANWKMISEWGSYYPIIEKDGKDISGAFVAYLEEILIDNYDYAIPDISIPYSYIGS